MQRPPEHSLPSEQSAGAVQFWWHVPVVPSHAYGGQLTQPLSTQAPSPSQRSVLYERLPSQ